MIDIINKIINYSKKNKLANPATDENIKRIELMTGFTIPYGFYELYKITNGAIFFNCELLNIDDIMIELNKNIYIEKEDLIVMPENYIKKVITAKNRIPLFREKENYLFIDLEPDINGVIGQIILFYNNQFRLIANNLYDLFDGLLSDIDTVYKSDLFDFLIKTNVNFIKPVDNSKIPQKLSSNKVQIEIIKPENMVLEKIYPNKEITMNLLEQIVSSLESMRSTFKNRIENKIIIFDPDIGNNEYSYYQMEEVYNNNFTVNNSVDFIKNMKSINLKHIKYIDCKFGLIYRIDDKTQKKYLDAIHKININITHEKIYVSYIFNIKENYIYNEINNILNLLSSLNEVSNNELKIADVIFEKLDKEIIDSVCELFKTEMSKYTFDRIDESKINYNSSINQLISNIIENNWVDIGYAEKIMEIEQKNISDLTIDEIKKYFSSMIKREQLESGYIAILIDKGIFEKLVFRLQKFKENGV